MPPFSTENKLSASIPTTTLRPAVTVRRVTTRKPFSLWRTTRRNVIAPTTAPSTSRKATDKERSVWISDYLRDLYAFLNLTSNVEKGGASSRQQRHLYRLPDTTTRKPTTTTTSKPTTTTTSKPTTRYKGGQVLHTVELLI